MEQSEAPILFSSSANSSSNPLPSEVPASPSPNSQNANSKLKIVEEEPLSMIQEKT
jgi:hypothetical protein